VYSLDKLEKAISRHSPCPNSPIRGLAEGILFQQPRFRTQSRFDLQNVLRRIRQAAQRDKDLSFTALLHHVYDVGRLRKGYWKRAREGPQRKERHKAAVSVRC